MPSVLALLTGLSTSTIRKLVSCELHVVLKSGDEVLDKKSIVSTQVLSGL